MRKSIATIAVLAAAAGTAVTAAPASASSRVTIFNCAGTQQVAPTSIVLACGDGYTELEKIRWHSWGSTIAEGTAVLAENNCKPDCISGHWVDTTATVAVSHLRGGHYTDMVVGDVTYALTRRGPAREQQ